MGLRPSVKGDGGSSGGEGGGPPDAARRGAAPPSTESSGSGSGSDGGGPSAAASTSSTSSSSAAPQREAWTARGQLLLDFHHAISRAINSPEMARKCSEIAEDMLSRSEESANTNAGVATKTTARPLRRRNSMAEEYGAEAALIVENKSRRDALVRNKSLAVGLLAFITLRSGRGLGAHVRKSIAGRSSRSYSFDAMPVGSSLGKHVTRPAADSPPAAAAAAASTAGVKQPSTLRKALRLTLDVSISTTLALLSGTFLFMPRPSAYIEDMAQLPLVEGKSVYAEMVCPPLLREYRRVLEQYGGRWPVMGSNDEDKREGLTQEDVSLNVIRKFVENCSKRSKYEQALLEERNALAGLANDREESTVSMLMKRITSRDDNSDGGSTDDSNSMIEEGGRLGTVSVPSPGVPEDIEVDVDRDVFAITADDDAVATEGGTGGVGK